MNKLLISIVLILGIYSCKNSQKVKKQELPFRIKFDRMIAELPEYKRYKSESDSLRYFGRRQEVYIRIFEKSDLKEDSLKNIAIGFVIKDTYSSRVPMVKVKYDRDLDSIVEVVDMFKALKDSLKNKTRKTVN